jgi:hypothetical protein
VDEDIAVGHSSGVVVVYQLPSFTNGGKARNKYTYTDKDNLNSHDWQLKTIFCGI